MNRKKARIAGPSVHELKLKTELDLARREVQKLKREQMTRPAPRPAVERGGDHPVTPAGEIESAPLAPAAADVAAIPSLPMVPPGDPAAMMRQIEDLSRTRQRLSKLYFSQVEENRKRAAKLHQILENIYQINSELDLDTLLARLAETLRQTLRFNVVLIRIREPGTGTLVARAFAGIDEDARVQLSRDSVGVEDFESWLKDEFRISRSYFISHAQEFNDQLPAGYKPELGPRKEFEWHQDDVLLVPLFDRKGDLLAYFSVDDPEDRLVPSKETIELIEIFGNHAVVAIENARLYRQLEKHSRELESAGQRMQEMNALRSNFVSTVSHELRTPLTAIRAYVDTVLGATETEMNHGQVQRFMGIISEETERLTRLIESLLDLNRFDSGAMRMARQTVDIAEVLEETARLLQPVAQAGRINLKVNLDTADTRADGDRDQLRQLALHLGSNAVKFTPPGGAVSISLTGDDRDVTLEVQDSGIGIPEPMLEKIFERFFQVDSSLVRRYGGTGLGLAICKSIVEWHGGRLYAVSQQGKGSTFTVVLPRRTGPRIAVRPSPSTHAAPEDILRLAIEMVAEVMNARVVSLLAPGPDGDLVVQAALGVDETVVREAAIRIGTGVSGWVAQHRRPVCVTGNGDGSPVGGSGRRQYRTGTFLSVPIESENGLLGVLNVTDPVAEKPFDASDCQLLLQLAERVAAAWEQARAMNARRADLEDADRAVRAILKGAGAPGGAGSGGRPTPSRVQLATALARAMGLSEAEVALIGHAGTLRDVDLPAPGETEPRDELSQALLRPLDAVGAVREIVLAQSEWHDGSGYPQGLAGDEIPIGGRVLAVVDAFESFTQGRGGQSVLTRQDAMEALKEMTGRRFDPEVVSVFESAWRDVEQFSRGATGETATTQSRDRR
ncbi:MAG: ATP-binding protein [Candidatus Eisenbacteria bacterium]